MVTGTFLKSRSKSAKMATFSRAKDGVFRGLPPLFTLMCDFNCVKMKNILRETVDENCDSECANVELQDRNLTITLTVAMNKLTPKRVVHIRRETSIINYHIKALEKET